MEEKVILKGNSQRINILTIIFGIISVVFVVLAISMVTSGDSNMLMWITMAIVSNITTVLVFGIVSCCELVVTDKRIYGKVVFGKQVNLPLDSVSAVATTSVFTQGVSVATSSGRITFFYLPNSNEICEKINELLIKRQNKNNEPTIKQQIPQSNADELRKYKDLFDSGVITQEEFEAKKKQLLDL